MARRRRRGEGTVYASEGGWIASFPLGIRNGRRVRKRVRCATQDEADDELERLRRTYGAGGIPADGTLDEYLAAWLRDVRPTIAPSTFRSYSDHVKLHISPLLGGIPVAKLRSSDVRRLIADRLAATSNRRPAETPGRTPVDDQARRPLSPSTVARIVTTLRIALEAGVRNDELTVNVAARVRLPRAAEHRVEPMTEADAEALVAAFAGHWLSPLVRLLAGSGLRLGEAVSLNQGDAFEEERFVRIRKSKTTIRAVPISADAAEAIRAAKAAAPRRGPREPLFFSPRGVDRNRGQRDRLKGASVSHAVPRVIEAAGLERLTPHGFRHGLATRLVSKGVHMRIVAGQLGHANPSLTARVYAHVVPQVQREAVALLDKGETG